MEIVSARYTPDFVLETPPAGAGEGSRRAAGAWARNWALGALQVGSGGRELSALFSAAMLALTPVVAVTGAVYGVFAAEEPEVIRESKMTLERAIKAQNWQ